MLSHGLLKLRVDIAAAALALAAVAFVVGPASGAVEVPAAAAASTCTSVSAQVTGSSPVTVSATGTCPAGSSPKYTYFVGPTSSGPWTLEDAWTGPSWNWNPSFGQYAVVWVSDGPYTVPQAQTLVALDTTTPCTAVSARVTGSSPVTVSATGTCPAGSSPKYTYFVGPTSSGPWTLEDAWTGPSWNWNPSFGQYAVVWVSDGPYTVPQAQTLVALDTTTPCTAVSARVTGSSPVTVSATGTCPAGSSPKYTYFVGPTSSGPWTLEDAWTGPSWNWNPSFGQYAVVWVSDGPYTVPQAQTLVALDTTTPCTAVSARVTGSSPVTVSATGTCPAGSSPKYTYFVGPTSSGPWTLEDAWTGPSWNWNPSFGQYAVVWVSDGPYTVPQAQTLVALSEQAPACTAVSATSNPVGPVSVGTKVTINASSTCSPSSGALYSYFTGPTSSGPWTLTAAWIGPSWTWNTNGVGAGTYYVIVWASDGPYTVPQVETLTSVTLTSSPLANPASNLSPTFVGTCYGDSYQSLACQQAEVANIDTALSDEGLGPLTWTTALYSLPLAEQEFVVTNEERVLRGLEPIVGMDTAADQNALVGAEAGKDPPLTGVPGVVAAKGNWAEDFGALGSDFDWMYNDGPGSFNLDCPAGSTSSLCWAHRDAILTNTVAGALAPPSGYTWVSGDACVANSSTALLSNCDLEYDLVPTASVTYDFTWAQAVTDGA